jgi:hypothetical protein
MTREMPQGARETPAWLGELTQTDPEPAGADDTEVREPAPTPPTPGSPLWPTEARRAPSGPGHIEPVYTDPDADPEADPGRYPTYRESSYADTGAARPAAAPEQHDPFGAGSLGLVAVTGRRATLPPRSPRPVRRITRRSAAAPGLVALILLALLSAFFGWVTAEPLWLAMDHARAGTVTVTRCTDSGPTDRCTGTFTSADGRFTRNTVPVMGVVPDVGATAPARMTSARGAHIYVDVDAGGRAAAGVLLILVCGLGIVRATGVRHLPTKRTRRVATLLSLIGPLALLAGMLAITY